ncbi:uncharacterized protein LOC132742664 [Ruditapes philippinarum]|uniref:uncharacterized protein LOC132742664 n=1 Tax=Ruditapes philippinarum TaxID=129788 RepID=UPI00295B88CE|nr:uncharacterized protein LOC132742664 [Ruditapes philippinarum]
MATAAGYTDEIIDYQHEMAVDEGSTGEDIKAESDSLTQESDEVLEMFCEHCEKDLGETVKADGFCAVCFEYMCATCLRYHQRYKSDHTIQDSANMPQDFCFQKCQDHPKELIKFYCMTCQLKTCTVCKLSHQNECTIKHIPSLVKSVDLRCTINEVIKEIDIDLEALSESKTDVTSKLSDVQSISQNAKSSVREHMKSLKKVTEDLYQDKVHFLQQKKKSEMEQYEKKRADILAKLDKEKGELMSNHQNQSKKLQVNKMLTFDKIERQKEKLDKQSESTKLKDETRLNMMSSKSSKIETQLKSLRQNLSKKMLENQKCETFLSIKEARQLLEKMNPDVKEVSQPVEISNYEFLLNDKKITSFFRYFLYPLHISIDCGSFMEKSKIRRKINFSNDIFTAHSTNKKTCEITGLCKISDNYLLAADWANASIKLINIVSKFTSDEVKLDYEPFDLTLIKTNMVATTMPNVGKIQLISITQENKFVLSTQVKVPDKCYGIAFKKPNLVVSCQGEVYEIELNGAVVSTITTSDLTLQQIGQHPKGNMFYVPGTLLLNTNGCITKIRTSKISIQRSPRFLKTVTGLAVDKSGTIYTCTTDGHSIVQLSADLETQHSHKVLLKQADRPLSLFYCNKENKLYIGTKSGTIKVFNVE